MPFSSLPYAQAQADIAQQGMGNIARYAIGAAQSFGQGMQQKEQRATMYNLANDVWKRYVNVLSTTLKEHPDIARVYKITDPVGAVMRPDPRMDLQTLTNYYQAVSTQLNALYSDAAKLAQETGRNKRDGEMLMRIISGGSAKPPTPATGTTAPPSAGTTGGGGMPGALGGAQPAGTIPKTTQPTAGTIPAGLGGTAPTTTPTPAAAPPPAETPTAQEPLSTSEVYAKALSLGVKGPVAKQHAAFMQQEAETERLRAKQKAEIEQKRDEAAQRLAETKRKNDEMIERTKNAQKLKQAAVLREYLDSTTERQIASAIEVYQKLQAQYKELADIAESPIVKQDHQEMVKKYKELERETLKQRQIYKAAKSAYESIIASAPGQSGQSGGTPLTVYQPGTTTAIPVPDTTAGRTNFYDENNNLLYWEPLGAE